MIDQVVLAMRASPDWGALAAHYAAGHQVHPSQYLPPMHTGFPTDIVSLIERWNRHSKVSYFSCRQRMREISALNIASVSGALSIRSEHVPTLLKQIEDHRLLLFYHDDDDWFHPKMATLIAPLASNLTSLDVAVFPFLRLASNVVTFTHDGHPTHGALGRTEPFRYRYCTNNYGLTARALEAGHSRLVEHIDASNHAAMAGFQDAHFDLIVSATSKTPCSASWLNKLPDDQVLFDEYIQTYIASLKNIEISPENSWLTKPLLSTIELFASAID